jgi:hypothetical protein
MRTLLALLMVAVSAACALAQDPAPAPIPLQITAGKKVFISNASGESNLPPGVADRTYNQFYASMKSWGRYDLVATPADADLTFEIRYEILLGQVHVEDGRGGSWPFHQLRLSILDPKTHIILWAFSEPVVQVAKKSTGMQNFQGAMDKLMGDIKSLATATAPAAASAQK